MQDPVYATGPASGSLCNTFGDKRARFIAALGRQDDRYRQAPHAERAGRYEPRVAIRQIFLGILAETAGERGNPGCRIDNTALEQAAHDAEIARIVAGTQEAVEHVFARMTRAGREAGEIPTPVKPTESARGPLATSIGLTVLVRSHSSRALLTAIVDEALRRFD